MISPGRLALVAPIAARSYSQTATTLGSRTVVVGHDRRFMAEAFARTAAELTGAAGLMCCLLKAYAPTLLSVGRQKQHNALNLSDYGRS